MDGRYKIQPSEHAKIRKLYEKGKSSREIAGMYEVAHNTILYIVSEDTKTKQKERLKGTWRKYYTKEKRRESTRKYRAKKREEMK